MAKLIRKGGMGSGNWGHAGRPGKVGGSAKNSGAAPSSRDTLFDLSQYDDAYPNWFTKTGIGKFTNPDGGYYLTELPGKREPSEDYDPESTDRMRQWMYKSADPHDMTSEQLDEIADKYFDANVARLSAATGIDPDFVHKFMREWENYTVGDTMEEDGKLQFAIAKVFHDKLGTRRYDDYTIMESDDEADKYTALVMAMYDQTQADLARAGIMEIEAYQPMTFDRGDTYFPNSFVGDEYTMPPEVASGWVLSMDDAREAALDSRDDDTVGLTAKMYIPAERILSVPTTGFGSLEKGEVVVIGGTPGDDKATIVETDYKPHHIAVVDALSTINEIYPTEKDREVFVTTTSLDDPGGYSASDVFGELTAEFLYDVDEGYGYSENEMSKMLKNDVVSYLDEATDGKYGYDPINAVIKQWAMTSNDYVDSLFLQNEAAELFHGTFGTTLSKFQEDLVADRKDKAIQNSVSDSDFLANRQTLFYAGENSTRKQAARDVLRATYNRTQDKLSSQGIDDGLTLFRGMRTDKYSDFAKGDEVEVDENALESWTSDIRIARDFADGWDKGGGVVLEAYIPRARILSTPHTGFGSYGESEFVVIGSNIGDKVDRAIVSEVVK